MTYKGTDFISWYHKIYNNKQSCLIFSLDKDHYLVYKKDEQKLNVWSNTKHGWMGEKIWENIND